MNFRRFALWILLPIIALTLILTVVARLQNTPPLIIDITPQPVRLDSLIPTGMQLVRFYNIPDTSYIYAKFTNDPLREVIQGGATAASGNEKHIVIDFDAQQIILNVSFSPINSNALGIEFRETNSTLRDPILQTGNQYFLSYLNSRTRHVPAPAFINQSGSLFYNYKHVRYFVAFDGTQTTSLPTEIRELTHDHTDMSFEDWLVHELSLENPGPFPNELFLWDTPVPGIVWMKQDRVQAVYNVIEQTPDGPRRHSIRFAQHADQSQENRARFQRYDYRWLHDNWNFGSSRLYTSTDRLRVLEFMAEHLAGGDVDQVFKPRGEFTDRIVTSMNNDLRVLTTTSSTSTILLMPESTYTVYERSADGDFGAPVATRTVPALSLASPFPIDDEHLLVYHDGAFWSMHWDTQEMTQLWPSVN